LRGRRHNRLVSSAPRRAAPRRTHEASAARIERCNESPGRPLLRAEAATLAAAATKSATQATVLLLQQMKISASVERGR